MNNRLNLPTVAVILIASPVTLAVGEILVDESFDYPLGAIAGQVGGIGFNGAYTGGGNVTSPGQTYPGLITFGNTFSTAGSNNGAFRLLQTPVGTDAGTLYVRFLGSNTSGSAPDYAGLSFFNGAADEELFFGKTFNAANYGFEVSDVPNGQGARNAANGPISATTTLLVYRLSFTPTGDTIDLFVNPGSSLAATPDATFTTTDDAIFSDTFDRIRLQSGANAPTFDYDEIRFATTEAEVLSAIPEPSTFGLLGLTTVGIAALRRRRA